MVYSAEHCQLGVVLIDLLAPLSRILNFCNMSQLSDCTRKAHSLENFLQITGELYFHNLGF